MYACNNGWYRKILNEFVDYKIGFDSYSVETMLSLLFPYEQDEEIISELQSQRDIAFSRLAMYLRELWKSKCYRKVLEFLICARGTDIIDVDKLYDVLGKRESMKSAIKLSIDMSKKFGDTGILSMSFEDWAELVYREEIIGFQVDIKNIKKSDIDKMGTFAGDDGVYFFRPLMQHLVSSDELELVWYTLCNYVIPSLCKKDCRRNRQVADYLRLYIGELMGELWNLSYISGEVGLFFERGDSLLKILLTDDKNSNEFNEAVNKLLFGDSKRFKELCLNKEIANSLLQLFQSAIHRNELLPNYEVEYFCHLITVVMMSVGMRDEAADFICTYKEYFQFTSLEIVVIVAIVALCSDNFETGNMLYGIFLTEKSQVDRLRSILTTYIKRGADYLNNVRALYSNNKDECIDLFSKKFFIECGVLEFIRKIDNLEDLTDIDLLNKAKDMTAFIKAVSYEGRLNSTLKNKKINFVYRTIGLSAAADRELYVETDFISDEIKAQGKAILNSIDPQNAKINNIKYRRTYSVVNEALSRKSTYLYLENMSEIIGDILREQPEKYRKYLNEWDENKAKDLFVKAYINYKDIIELPSYLRECFINKYKSGKFWDYFRDAHQIGLFEYFKNIYVKADNKYEQLFENEEVKKQLLTGEWLWDEECNDIESIENYRAGQEFTYLVANYLKSVEIFLAYKIENAAKTLNKNVYFEKKVKGNMRTIIVGAPNWTRDATMGDLYHLVMNFPDLLDENLHKLIVEYLSNIESNGYSNPVVKYLKKFTDEIRNGYFHKDTILDFQRAFEIRNQTLFVIRRIVADFR